jgi:transposase
VRLQNQLEALLEEAHIKLSSLVSDLLGASARRMLKALAEGETDPLAVAALADQRLRATSAELRDALGACTELNPVYRRLVRMALEQLHLIEQQIGQLDQEIAGLLRPHQDAVERLAEVPGLGVDSAQQIIAEVGATAATFPSAKNLVSWVGACPGEGERGGEPQQALAQRQPPDAPHSESSCECCRQTQRKHLRNPLSSFGTAPWTP